MEEWETLIKVYQHENDPEIFSKVLRNAEVVLLEELTPFEIEWILTTLLQEPVHLLEVVTTKYADSDWKNCVRNTLKLLSDIVTKHDAAEKYYEDIVQLCLLNYEPLLRQQALSCVTKVASRSVLGACHFCRHVSALGESTTCKAPLAVLVGTICEHHPNVVEGEMTKTWRVFFNLLDSNKSTVTVMKAVLEGISGLFKHFGKLLPTIELDIFYDKLVSCLELSRCEEVCLKILENYSNLFRERISSDKRLRALVWSCSSVSARPAILAIYRAVCSTLTDDNSIQEILNKEINPRTKSPGFYERFTALRALTDIHTLKGLGDLSEHVDLQVLDSDLRNGNVNYETCEAVSWCVQSGAPFSERVFLTAILCYDRFPANKRTEVVIHSLLRANDEVRIRAVNFLIAESISPTTKERCMVIWKDIFDTKGNTDNIVLENSIRVATDVIEYVTGAVNTFLEGDDLLLPEAVPALLSLLMSVLRLHSGGDLSVSLLARALRQLADRHADAVPAAILCCLYSVGSYENMSLDRCHDEDMREQFALALLETTEEFTCPAEDMLLVLEIIFERNDVDSSVLSKAVRELSKLLEKNSNLDERRVAAVIQKVVKLSQHIGKKSKYDRILHWDILTYLGKYGRQYESYDDTNDSDNILIYKLKNNLILDLPHNDGNLKVNLQGVLHSAIKQEDATALNVLLTIICANLATRKHADVQTALVRVLVSLSHCGTDVSTLHTALSLCDGFCANELMRYIVRERSCRARKVLLGAAEALLQLSDGEILENILEYIVPNLDDLTNQSGADITEFLLKQLAGNNSLCEKYLPVIIKRIVRSDIQNVQIKMAADIFIDKIALYTPETRKDLMEDLLKIVNSTSNLSKINTVVEFVKKIWDVRDKEIKDILGYYFEIISNCHLNLHVFMVLTRIFELGAETVQNAFLKHDFIQQILDGAVSYTDYYNVEVQLDFFKEFRIILLYNWSFRNSLHKQIMKLTPQEITNLNRKLTKYLSILNSENFEVILLEWFQNQPISEITENIERYIFERNHEDIVRAMKIMHNAYGVVKDGPVMMQFGGCIKRWAEWVARLNAFGYVERNSKSKMAFFMDLVEVSFRFMNDDEIVGLMKKGGSSKDGVQFYRMFMPAVFERLVTKPYLLLRPEVEEDCTVLNDIVKYAARRSRGDDVLELVDLLWPTYSQQSSMKQKQSLLLDLSAIPTKHPPGSNVMRWTLETISSEGTKLEDKVRLFGTLPKTKEYKDSYRPLCSHLPARVGELRPVSAACLQALLDALADTGDTNDTLLQTVINLAASDSTAGWWDEAIDSCMATVAARAHSGTSGAVFARCFEGRGLGVCTRFMLPLLRHSTSTLCEEFFSKVLEELLSILSKSPREVRAHYTYEKCVLDYVRALRILQLVFLKVPKERIDSPCSVLYSRMRVGVAPSYIVRTVCKLCVTLRSAVRCPEGADDGMKESCRLFHSSNYSCLSAALCCSQLKPAVLATVFDGKVWDTLIDDEEIQLPLKQQWNVRSTRQAVCISVSGELLSRTAGTARTERTRAFLRTLSENPLQYDLVQEDEQPETQQLELTDNALNRHECAGTVAALLSRVSALEGAQWRDALVAALEGDARRNVKWLLAQAICNTKEDLKPHASALRPALLAVIVDTARDKKLNGLHIDILDTLIFWREGDPEPSALLNSVIEHIIATAIHCGHNKNIYYMLLDKLAKMLDKCVTIPWSCFETHLADTKSEVAKWCLDILKRITKCNVYIPELLPALATGIEGKWLLPELATLFGIALTAAGERGQPVEELLGRYRSVLQRLRRNDHDMYIRMLHAAQKGYPGCCDETNFRSITDLTPKIVGRPKLKCLEILSTHALLARRSEHVAAMFDTIGLVDMTSTLEALVLIRNGVHLMEEHLRKRIVTKVAESCQHLPVKVRSVAYGVLVKALELLLSPEAAEPAAKRHTRASNSALLCSDDVYTEVVAAGVAQGMVEKHEEISTSVREGVGKCLSEDLGVRLCESFVLALVLPSKNTSIPSGSNLSAMLDVFLQLIRSQKVFQKKKLRDEPIEIRQFISSASSAKTLTQGLRLRDSQEPPTVETDVQTSLDDVLKSLLQFLEKSPEAAMSVVIQLVKAQRPKRPGFDFESIMAENVSKCLSTIAPITPWILQVAREIHIWDISDLDQTLAQLVKATTNTEDEGVCKLVYEDYKMRRYGPEMFLMGVSVDTDFMMSETVANFSLDDLIASFGKLSNWEELTSQQKQSVRCTLPPLWTDRRKFESCVQDYEFKGPTWLDAMVSKYRNGHKNSYQWVTELDRWPRKPFVISVLSETKSWERIGESLVLEESLLPKYIHPSECLAEWAARIMLRSSYLQSLNRDDSEVNYDYLSHSHELLWCVSANERGLHERALECCKSVSGLRESETLRWLRQKLIALRAIALERNDSEGLRSALGLAVTYTPQFIDNSEFGDVLGVNEIMLRLNRDLKSLKKEDIECITDEIKDKLSRKDDLSENCKMPLESIFVIAISYYDALWDTYRGSSEKSTLLLRMSEILEQFVNLDLGPKCKLLLDIIVNRLDDSSIHKLDEEVAIKLLSVLKLIRQHLDEISIGQLTSNLILNKFPDNQHQEFTRLLDQRELTKYKECLRLIGDPEHLLLKYCESLAHLLEKGDGEWSRIYDNMSTAIFNNPFAGHDYQVLMKYEKRLKDISSTDISKQSKLEVLSSIQTELRSTRRDTLQLSHLCPSLTQELEGDGILSTLLCLKRGVRVAKFEEKVSLFVDSVRRPAVVRCRLSDGSVARFIVKRGEGVRPHCVAMRLLTTAQAALPRRVNTGYYIAPLSEDCGLIQYLEDHERFRALVSSTRAVDSAVSTIHRAKDSELILAPNTALQQFEELCAKVPPYLLRSAIESTCVSLQDFIAKKKNFLESLSDMTLLSYLYGVGDRHLENMMYSIQDGSACHVDCGAILQYGGGELPPARLTRNILAVCDFTVIESRLQSILSTLRRSHELVVAAITVAFKWMNDQEFMKKLSYIEKLVRGSTLSHLVTIEVLSKSNIKYKEKYIELLQDVFADFDPKNIYSVEEQVSSMLRQSTEPRILSVTRSLWEPWI